MIFKHRSPITGLSQDPVEVTVVTPAMYIYYWNKLTESRNADDYLKHFDNAALISVATTFGVSIRPEHLEFIRTGLTGDEWHLMYPSVTRPW